MAPELMGPLSLSYTLGSLISFIWIHQDELVWTERAQLRFKRATKTHWTLSSVDEDVMQDNAFSVMIG